MIDTHIHLIPGVDDGAKDLAEAARMLAFASNEGVNEMILTPHFNSTLYRDKNVEKAFKLLTDYIASQKLEMKIHLGNEIYLNEEDYACIKNGQAHTMGDSRYLLLELPFFHFYPFHEMMIQELQCSEYKIVLAHAERYAVFEKKPEKLRELVKNGVYMQMTSAYIMDKKTRKKALKWVEDGLVHMVASDGHDVEGRPPVMKMAFEIVAGTFGNPCAERLFNDNPGLLIEDRELMAAPIKKAKRFAWPKKY